MCTVGPVFYMVPSNSVVRYSIVGRVSCVGSAPYRSCTLSHNGRLGSVDDLSDLQIGEIVI